ncbi:hypothetical protein BaRGS_00029035 [Batillaria attramentaria]|uniref:AIG1-type G domain-containing protein n=1 Tax=Batillaria attramentaria TaxID=370345 RepID=A0ABD0JYF0_9CAEN
MQAARPGPHVVLYVVRCQRYTDEDHAIFCMLKRLLGENVTNHMIVVMTGGDILEEGGVTGADVIQTAPAYFREVLEECGERLVVLNNKAKDTKTEVGRLFLEVEKVLRKTSGSPYMCKTAYPRPRDKELLRKELESLCVLEHKRERLKEECKKREILHQFHFASEQLTHETLRVILTSTDKSTEGRSILSSDDRQGHWTSITQSCRRREFNIQGTHIQIVEAPGILDTSRDEESLRKEVTKCVLLSAPGPHAVILVVKLRDRFTAKEYLAYEILKQLFGPRVVDYMIIAFTGAGKDVALQQIVRSAAKSVLEEVQNRCLYCNTSATDNQTRNMEILKLIEMINKLKYTSKKPFFVNSQIEEAEVAIETEIKKMTQMNLMPEIKARETLMMNIENDLKPSFTQFVARHIGVGTMVAGALALEKTGGLAHLAVGLGVCVLVALANLLVK